MGINLILAHQVLLLTGTEQTITINVTNELNVDNIGDSNEKYS